MGKTYKKEKKQLSQMDTNGLQAYGRICKMSKGMISNEPEKWVRHGLIVDEILTERGL